MKHWGSVWHQLTSEDENRHFFFYTDFLLTLIDIGGNHRSFHAFLFKFDPLRSDFLGFLGEKWYSSTAEAGKSGDVIFSSFSNYRNLRFQSSPPSTVNHFTEQFTISFFLNPSMISAQSRILELWQVLVFAYSANFFFATAAQNIAENSLNRGLRKV